MVYTGIRLLLLICPFISSFFFLSNFQTLKFVVTLFSGSVRPTRLKLGTNMDSGQMYRVYRNQAAAPYSSFFLFFFLSNFQRLKFFFTLFSGTVRPRRLKLGTHMDSGQMYPVYQNPAADAYSTLYFFIFLQFSNIKIFRHTFLRNCEAWKVDSWYTCGQWADVLCILESGCCCLFIPLCLNFSFFLQFSNIKKIFVTLFSGTVRPKRLKLGTHVDSGQMYRVYQTQGAAACLSLYFFSFLSLQF